MTNGPQNQQPRPAPVDLRCPICDAMNIPNAKPTLEIENGSVHCRQCGRNFVLPHDA